MSTIEVERAPAALEPEVVVSTKMDSVARMLWAVTVLRRKRPWNAQRSMYLSWAAHQSILV